MSKKINRSAAWAIGLSAAAVGLPLMLLAPGAATRKQKSPFKGRNFAHRGLHSRDRSVPENSLPAFERAAREGYGIELDVRLTRDGELVVFHDDELTRLCRVPGRVEDMDWAELRELHLLDSDCRIPLFSEVLETVRGRGALIVELKSGSRNRELCEKVWAQLREYKGDFCVESFNPLILAWFRIHARGVLRGQLAAPMRSYGSGCSRASAFLLSRCLLNFIGRPQFIAYKLGHRPVTVHLAELLGAMRVGWTSHEPRNEAGRDALIFEYYRPRLRYK